MTCKSFRVALSDAGSVRGYLKSLAPNNRCDRSPQGFSLQENLEPGFRFFGDWEKCRVSNMTIELLLLDINASTPCASDALLSVVKA
jgi:hypothetical protein